MDSLHTAHYTHTYVHVIHLSQDYCGRLSLELSRVDWRGVRAPWPTPGFFFANSFLSCIAMASWLLHRTQCIHSSKESTFKPLEISSDEYTFKADFANGQELVIFDRNGKHIKHRQLGIIEQMRATNIKHFLLYIILYILHFSLFILVRTC